MHIEVDYCGKTYVGAEGESGEKIETVAKSFYESLGTCNSTKLELEDGGFLVLGSIAVQTCVFRFVE